MNEIFEDMFEEADALADIDLSTGKQVSKAVKQLRNIDTQIDETEQHLKSLKAEREKLTIETLPNLMDEMNVERWDVDGVTVQRKLKVHASIPVARREEAFEWLRDNNCDDIIKNDVICSFSKGQDNVAGDVVGLLQEKGFPVTVKTHVHASTLKAFVKERFENGREIDLDMFGAFIVNAAEIRRKA